jgi:hypothetical protein
LEIPFRAAFAQQNVHAEPQLFPGFGYGHGLMIRSHSSQGVGIEIFAVQARGVTVNAFAFAGLDFGEFAFLPKKNARKIHEFRHARHAIIADHQFQIIGRDAGAGGFQVRGGNSTRKHDEEINRQILGGFEHVTNAVQAEDVGVFVGINYHRAGTVGDDGAGKFRRREHRAFHVEMTVNQTWSEISAAQIYHLAGFVVAKADHAAILDGHVCLVNLATEDVDDASVSEEEFSGSFAARYGKFLLHVTHG